MDLALRPKAIAADELQVDLKPSGPSDKTCISQLGSDHILKEAENDYSLHQHHLNLQILRNREGLHAPLKLSMELMAVKKVGHLPFLPSSNPHLDVLTGRDELIEFSDFLGMEENFEELRQPHAVVEKHLGIL